MVGRGVEEPEAGREVRSHRRDTWKALQFDPNICTQITVGYPKFKVTSL